MSNIVRFLRYDPAEVSRLLLGLSPEAELAHRRLADHHYTTGAWPAAGAQAARVGRVAPGRWSDVAAELAAVGWREQRGRFRNSWVRRPRAEAESAARRRSVAGRSAVRTRWARLPARSAGSRPDEPPLSRPRHRGAHTNRIPTAHESNANRMRIEYEANTNGTPPNETGPETDVEEAGTLRALNVKNVKDVKGTPSPIRLSAERSTRSALPLEKDRGAPLEKVRGDETQFLEAVKDMFGPNGTRRARLELENWGGWWRNRFRDNPDKARRVLAEVKGLARERKITTSPGAAAVDLWKRLP